MQNQTTTAAKNVTKQLQNVAESVKDSVEQVATDLSSKAKNLAGDTAEMATEYYDEASTWMQDNYGKTLGAIGMLAAAGLVGYFIGRSMSESSEASSPSRKRA